MKKRIVLICFIEMQGCQAPTSSNIENIDAEGMIGDVIMHGTWRHLWKKTHEKDVVGIVTFELIGSLPTNHIIAYITTA